MRNQVILAFALVVLANLAIVDAHMYFSNVIIGGQQNAQCVRPHPSSQYDYPISDKNTKTFETTPNMICGWPPATNSAQSKCAITAGSQITLQWWHAAPGDDVVDGSHRGPCLVYMAKSDNGQGSVWFKVYEEGYNPSTQEFCTDRIRKDGPNKGQLTITIPSDIQSGNYLLRTEFLALHEAYTEFGTQPYVGCAELTVSGGGSVDPPNKIAIPSGLYKKTDPGIMFNIYYPSPVQSYPIPGPALYVPGRAPSVTPSPATPAPTRAPSPATPAPTRAPSTSGTSAPATPAPSTSAPTSAPSTSAPSTPAPTDAPEPEPNTCSVRNCSIGSVGCQCSSGKCNGGLKCETGINICVYVECSFGTESCPCYGGTSCNDGLYCLSTRCVNASSLIANLTQTSDDKQASLIRSNANVLFVSLASFVVVFVSLL